jgi:alkaline phosphatase D
VLRAGLATAAALGVAPLLPGCTRPPAAVRRRRPTLAHDPFTLGVASGDPSADGMVLWTRLAVDPLAEDGLGGVGEQRTDVEWELADDERFTRVVRRGIETTGPELGHSVHVELAGLAAGRDYFYRFRTGGRTSRTGRTRTAPRPGALAPLRACVTSCAQYEHGYFTAYRRLAEDEPDLVLNLGDYLYEYPAGQSVAPSGNARDHVGPETTTLAGYRQRHAQYKADVDLQTAHAVAPWLVVFDDHEVENDWADEVPERPQPNFPARRAAALRAYWENMPLRASARPSGPDLPLHRRIDWGGLATLHMLDTRQYRRDQPCGDRANTDCPQRTDPQRTMLGPAQEQWLVDGLRRSTARWDLLAQQVFFSQVDLTPGPGRGFDPDTWNGYPVARDRLVDAWVQAHPRNVVVLTGDIHSHWAAEVRHRFDDPGSPVVGSELVVTSVASGGNGTDPGPAVAATLAENPHLKFFADRRGYLRTTVTNTQLTAEFRVVPFVRQPDAPAHTAASFVVEDRRAGLNQV